MNPAGETLTKKARPRRSGWLREGGLAPILLIVLFLSAVLYFLLLLAGSADLTSPSGLFSPLLILLLASVAGWHYWTGMGRRGPRASAPAGPAPPSNSGIADDDDTFRTLFDLAPYACSLTDMTGRYLMVNRAFAESARTPAEMLVGKRSSDIGLIDSATEAALSEELRKGGELRKREVTVAAPPGIERHLVVSTGAVTVSGQPCYLTAVSDVTEIRKAEMAAAQSERKYRSLFESAGDAILLMSEEGILDCNAMAERVFGRKRMEMIGSTTADLSPELQPGGTPSAEMARDLIRAAITGTNQSFEWVHLRKNGKSFVAEVSLRALRIGEGDLLQAIVRDITPRKEMESAIRQSEEKFRSFVEQTEEGVIIADGEERIIEWNRGVEKISGISRTEALARPIGEVFERMASNPARFLCGGESLREAIRKFHDAGTAEVHPPAVDCDIRTPDGRLCHIQQSIFPIRASGELRLAIVVRDVTVQKEAEAALNRAKEIAEESSRVKSVLLANLSHEFRTPLTGILGLSELLKEEPLDPAHMEMVDGIALSGRRLLRTLQSILELARLASGDVRVKPVPVPIGAVLARVADRHRDHAAAKGLALNTEVGEGGEVFLAEGDLLSDLLGYLVDNAIKFTNEGSISIRSRAVAGPGGRRGSIEVSDTGIGIAEEKREVIFEEFRQGTEGMNRPYEGAGVGLTVAKKLAHLLGGDVAVASEVGKGSTFTVWLRLPETEPPAHPSFGAAPTAAARPKAAGGPHPGKPNVLIVEDNLINKMVMTDFLAPICQTDHAPNGKIALEKASGKAFDVILMDINLGKGPNGIETTREIRNLPGYASVPIVAVTGHSLPGDRERLMEQGLNLYLPKPFGKTELVSVVESALKQR